MISIPNGKLADMRLETFAARDRVRLLTTVGLVYGTTAEQLKQVMEGFREALRAQPELWPDSVSAWFVTNDFDRFKRLREDVLLGFLAAVEKAGTSIAFPTQTLHLRSP